MCVEMDRELMSVQLEMHEVPRQRMPVQVHCSVFAVTTVYAWNDLLRLLETFCDDSADQSSSSIRGFGSDRGDPVREDTVPVEAHLERKAAASCHELTLAERARGHFRFQRILVNLLL